MHEEEEDDMGRFIAQQRARLAHERDTLERNPPSAVATYILDDNVAKPYDDVVDKRILKDRDISSNVAAVKTLQTKPPTPQILKLGEAYKQQKEKLKEELREEYRKALVEKQGRTTGVRGKMVTSYNDASNSKKKDELDLGLSLPIRDHLSAKPPVGDKKPVITETYQELLDRKRREEKAYRNADFAEEENRYREKRKFYDDEDRYRSKKVAFPSKRRPRVIERYYDDDDDDETEEELIERLRARRQKKQRSRRYVDSDDDEDDDSLFQRLRPKQKEPPRQEERRNSAELRTRKPLVASDKQNDLRSRSAPPDQEEYTGLPIGKVPSANTVQRRKDEYKLDLQRQIQENTLKKKRGKELEQQLDATAADESNKKDKRTNERQRASQRKQDASPPDADRETKKKSKKKGKERSSLKRRSSSDSDSDDDGRSYRGRPPRPGYYPTHMNGYFPPQPMQFQSPYDEAYYYYGTRNPLDPAGMMSGAPLNPQFQPGMSPLLAAADSKISNKGPQTTRFSEDTKDFPKQSGEKGTFLRNTGSSLVANDSRDTQKKKELMQTYQDELKEQMSLKEMKRQQEKLEQERYDRKMEMEAMSYNPWGKGGGGAPMKDLHGNLVSDLRQMHIQNEDLVKDPSKVAELAKQRQQMIENTEEIFHTPRKQETLANEHLSPRYGRSNPFEQKETYEQKSQKDVYKDELQKQIEEHRREEARRKEQLRLAEEKEEMRMQEENRKMQEEYENEQRKQREKIEEQKRKNEELQRALEEKRREEERRRKEEQRKREEEDRAEKERELQEKLKRATSPPIKSHEIHTGRSSISRKETARSSVSRKETAPKQVVIERVYQPPPADRPPPPPIIHDRQQTPTIVVRPDKSRESKRISRELSALRKQLLNEQQRIENQLRTSETSAYQFSSYQPTMNKPETLIDLSQARQRPVQVVRRPPTVDRPNSKALKDFTELKHRQDDTASLRMFRIQHPETPADTEGLEKQQRDMIKDQLMKIESLKHNTLQHPHHSRRSPTKSGRNGFSLLPPSDSYASLLDAETTFVPLGDDNDLENQPPITPIPRGRKASARERRRIKRSETQEDGGQTYRAAPDNYSVNSLNSLATLDLERMANKNQTRLNKLKAMQGDEVSLTDPDDILDRFVHQQKATDVPDTPETFAPDPRRPRKGTSISAPQQERSPSVNTVDTELWLRPGTGPAATAT